MEKTKFRQTAQLRPERVNLRAQAGPTLEIRPGRLHLQARLDDLAAHAAWQVSDDGQSITGSFSRPAKSELAEIVCLLTDVAPKFGVSPRVSFEGGGAWVTFTGLDGELSRRAVGFATLADDLFPAAVGSIPTDLPEDGAETGEEPVDVPVVSEPTEPVGDVIAMA